MIKKAIDFLFQNGITFMVAGFIIAAVSIIVFMVTRFYGNAVPQIAMGCFALGVTIYVTGRIAVATKNQYMRKQNLRSPSTKDDL